MASMCFGLSLFVIPEIHKLKIVTNEQYYRLL